MKRAASVIILLSLLVACHTSEEVQTTVRPFHAGDTLSGKILYALPQTSLVVRVTVEKTMYIPGPFRAYAKKYLTIDPPITERKTEWKVVSAGISSFREPDPSHYFVVSSGGILAENALRLTRSGLILDLAATSETAPPAYSVEYDEPDGKPYFTDLSVKRNFEEKEDTVYRTLLQDTGFVRVPVIRKTMEEKTLEQKAEEAANFIIKIRKRRFKLMAGQYDVYPKDEALEFAVKEMTRLENEYLALFTGKKVTQKWYYRFIITPEDPSKQPVVFRFSPSAGVCHGGTCQEGMPVYLSFRKLGAVPEVAPVDTEWEAVDKLFYRIPQVTDVRLICNDRILAARHVRIYQFGPVITLPANVILPTS